MNILTVLQDRFRAALSDLVDDPAECLDMIRPSQDAKFGDFQGNFAMPLGKRLGRPPREVAQQVVDRLQLDDLCQEVKVDGPGFINLRLSDQFLIDACARAIQDARLGIEPVAQPRTYVIDYSGPNVAKPMHVGHIRSTVIGDALVRMLRFLGHRAIGDNHIGDWGTQFGMIIFGYKHFRDDAKYRENPVQELSRLYRHVNRLVDYHEGRASLPRQIEQSEQLRSALERMPAANPADKPAVKSRKQAETKLREAEKAVGQLQKKLADVESDPVLAAHAREYPAIGQLALAETAKLHEGDAENLALWHEFLPPCLEEIERMYRRLGVKFDHTLGESFYHDRLAAVVDDLTRRGLARESDGATCVFVEGQSTPLIIRKQDGAFLYATTDLATIEYRVDEWSPDALLYVVDHRQGLHFEQVFATARLWGFSDLEYKHVSFGTVTGPDGKPYKSRSGDTIGLDGLLDEAVERALAIVSENDDAKKDGPELSAADRARVAETVGIGALKYADLSHNRTSDYEFSYDKMLAFNGNTATYMQYAYARVRSIFVKGKIDIEALRGAEIELRFEHPAERALALELLRFSEALSAALDDYRPNVLTTYLFELANRYSTFFENCPVIKAETPELRDRRALLCDLTARTLKQGLTLLGIDVVEKM